MKDKPMIYLVDDDDAVRDSLTFLLESHGFDVSAFASTAEFTRAYRARANACLILDHHLPGTSGLEFLASPKGAALHMPVILITGGADPTISARAHALGVAAFLEKPVGEAPLLAAIENALAA
ncbi:MAG: response regulator [Alphaproteobacteria bacterium]|nr:response regulator [Alphaproteobacteria bacterium]MDE1930097.1 response regulator [Alphaproteobacteria bacterium]